jgi:MFS-type transporter involved in bile tolerance (Atg22 family)
VYNSIDYLIANGLNLSNQPLDLYIFIAAVFLLPPRRSSGPYAIVNPFNPAKSYARYLSMLKEYKQLKNTIRFLMAWFFLSDGGIESPYFFFSFQADHTHVHQSDFFVFFIFFSDGLIFFFFGNICSAFSTLTSTAVLFAKTTLEMRSTHLILIGVIVPTTGIIGALMAPRIQQKLEYCSGLNGSLKMFKLLIGFSCLVPGYVSITLVFGIPVLTTEAEMFVLAAVFGPCDFIFIFLRLRFLVFLS